MRVKKASQQIFKTQLPVDYINTSLVINTFEIVNSDLSGGKPCKLWYIIIEQTNNGATAEDIQVDIVINGTSYTFARANAVSGTPYYGNISHILSAGDFECSLSATPSAVSAVIITNQALPFIADSVGLIREKQTTDVDLTAAQIEVNIIWEKLEAI